MTVRPHTGDAPHPHDDAERGSHLAELDLLRGQAILAVVTLHAGAHFYVAANPATPGGFFAILLRCIAIVGVPAFLMLSAAVLQLSYPTPFGTMGAVVRFYGRRGRRVLLPYVSWSLILLALNHGSTLTAATVGEALLRGSASFQFYFIPLICQFYLLFPVLQPAFRRRDEFGISVLASAGAVLATSLWWEYRTDWLSDAFWLPNWFVYPMLGGLLAGRLHSARTRLPNLASLATSGILWLVFVALLTLRSLRVHNPFSPTMYQPLVICLSITAVVSLFIVDVWLARSPGRFSRFCGEIGRHSYGIFLVHALILGFVEAQTSSSLSPRLGTALILLDLAAALGLSYLIIRALAKIPLVGALLT